MSRYSDYDDYDENFPNQGAFWHANAERALKGKRGRRALRDLREALMALPEHKLIEGAVCTVDAERRRSEIPEPHPWTGGWERQDFDLHVERDGEGVCAIGAYLWHQKVKAGMDPAEAFASLPTVFSTDEDMLSETAVLGKREGGLAFPLAWMLAYRNDETYDEMPPDQRFTRFIAWIDQELASTA